MAFSVFQSVDRGTEESIPGRLLRACISGDIEVIRSLRSDHSVRGLVDFKTGRTALHFVVFCGKRSRQCCEILLEAGCPVDVVDFYGITPFILANMYANQGMLEAYRTVGAGNLDAGPYNREQIHWSNLMRACHGSKVPQIRHCLDRGDDVDARNAFGQTALHIAVLRDNTLAVQMLIEGGCEVDAQDVFRWTPLMLACRRGMLTMVNTLLEQSADMQKVDIEGHTVLHTAILQGNTELLSCLLQFKVEAFRHAIVGSFSPLELAVACQHEHVVSWFSEESAPVSSFLTHAFTLAVRLNNFALMRKLVVMGVSVECSHVTMAVEREDIDLCRYLLACGVNLKKDGINADSPLVVACQRGNVTCIRMLLEAGCQPNSEFGGVELLSHPLSIAMCQSGSAVVFELLRAGADPDMDRYCVTATGMVQKPTIPAMQRQAPAAEDELPEDFATSVRLCLRAGADYDELSRVWTEPGRADPFQTLRNTACCPSLQHACSAAVWEHLIAHKAHGSSFIHLQKAVELLPVPVFMREMLLFPYALQGRSVLSQLWENRHMESLD
eukprot:scpid45080/ scgid34296/ Ankyrin repeat and KH domain-containing protein mask; Multiple ankyrin repeat single KH domain-containing protein